MIVAVLRCINDISDKLFPFCFDRDALITSVINCFTSFLAGFVVFSVLGYMSFILGKPIKTVAEEGPGLVFVAYPQVSLVK